MRTAVLIDDNIDELESLEQALREADPRLGCISLVFPDDALFAIEHEFKFCPQFIFLNIELKRKSGTECLAKLNQLSNLNNCTIVIFSNVLPPPLIDIFKNLGADFAFHTPNTRSQYKEIVSSVLGA